MKQVRLRSLNTIQVVWVEDHPFLKPGNHLILKGDPTKWNIDQVYVTKCDKGELYKPWHVGGL